MVKIVVDAYGGDHAPEEIVKGCTDALKRESDVSLVLTGDETKLAQLCAEYGCDASRVEIVHAPDVIGNEDVPTVAIRKKSDSSLVRALRRAKEDDEVIGMVSAGSTGAFLAGSLLIIGRLKSVMRHALAPLLPTVVKGQKVLLLDCGANTDCKAEYLAQFALMGDAYMRSVCKIECPRIALLSNGTEDKKGCRLTQDAFKILKQLPINFVGNMEARDVNSGKYDVVVADGFYGNICLKSIEGSREIGVQVVDARSPFFVQGETRCAYDEACVQKNETEPRLYAVRRSDFPRL